MKLLRALFTGWPGVFAFLLSPTLAVIMAPQYPGEWKSWLVVAPFLVLYLWFTWPRGPDHAH